MSAVVDAALESRIRNDELSEVEAQALEDLAARIMYHAIGPIVSHPDWTETYSVESRTTFEFLGHVGRLGYSRNYTYDDGLPGDRGKGRRRSLPEAILALAQLAEVTE